MLPEKQFKQFSILRIVDINDKFYLKFDEITTEITSVISLTHYVKNTLKIDIEWPNTKLMFFIDRWDEILDVVKTLPCNKTVELFNNYYKHCVKANDVL